MAVPGEMEVRCEPALNREMMQVARERLRYARDNAMAGVSGFKVGAAVVCASGEVYVGQNMELGSMNETVHAEQAALALAFVRGERRIIALVTEVKPCGHCLQFIKEVAEVDGVRLVSAVDERSIGLRALLPDGIWPSTMVRADSANVFSPIIRPGQNNSSKAVKLAFTSERRRDEEDGQVELADAALRAAESSHAPYSGNRAGVALRLACDSIITGPVIESLAFNPTMPPLHVALVIAAAERGPDQSIIEVLSTIRSAVLVETGGEGEEGGKGQRPTSWERQTRTLLDAINADASFEMRTAKVV